MCWQIGSFWLHGNLIILYNCWWHANEFHVLLSIHIELKTPSASSNISTGHVLEGQVSKIPNQTCDYPLQILFYILPIFMNGNSSFQGAQKPWVVHLWSYHRSHPKHTLSALPSSCIQKFRIQSLLITPPLPRSITACLGYNNTNPWLLCFQHWPMF